MAASRAWAACLVSLASACSADTGGLDPNDASTSAPDARDATEPVDFDGGSPMIDASACDPSPAMIERAAPGFVRAGSIDTVIEVLGSRFDACDRVITNDGVALTTVFVDPSVLRVELPRELLAEPRVITLILEGNAPTGSTFVVVTGELRVTSVSPTSVLRGEASLELRLSGEGLLELSCAAQGLVFNSNSHSGVGTYWIFNLASASDAPLGAQTIACTSALGSVQFQLEVIDPSALTDVVITSTVVNEGTIRGRDVIIEAGARLIGDRHLPLGIYATRDIIVRGAIDVSGAPGEHADHGGGGGAGSSGGAGGGGAGGGGPPARGGEGEPAGDDAPSGEPAGAGALLMVGGGAGTRCGDGGGGAGGAGIAGAGGGANGSGSGGAAGLGPGFLASNQAAGGGGGGGAGCRAAYGGGGGGGGGRLEMIAGRELRIEGAIYANGGDGGSAASAGAGGSGGGGGGGGGSGGLVGLHAPAVVILGTIEARGGDGGASQLGHGGGGGGGGRCVTTAGPCAGAGVRLEGGLGGTSTMGFAGTGGSAAP